MTDIQKLKIKIFADGADFESINKLNTKNYIRGFTTNPSLMKKAGIKNYKEFALKILSKIKDKPISFEVFSDDLIEMEKQAMEIASWGKNVNVKIPVTNTKKESTTEIIERLSNQGIECNITAIFTVNQLKNIVQVLNKNTPAILSVFAGRIADTGINPENIMAECVQASKSKPKSEILWASTRELVNIFQADKIGCQIITVPHEILSKIDSIGKNLEDYSLDTVKSFYKDAIAAGFNIDTK